MTAGGTDPATARHQRARGAVRAGFRRATDGGTRIERLYQAGSARALLPRNHGDDAAELVSVNTAGGLAAGDRFGLRVAVDTGCRVRVTTQAAERVYASPDGLAARVANRVSVAAGARLEWLPQETILFDRARLDRRLLIDMARGAEVIVLEMLVFGRSARGEMVRAGMLRDRWRIVRDGALLHAESIRLDGDIQRLLDDPAVAAGGRAVATLLYLADDSAVRLPALRDAVARSARVEGAAGIVHDALVVRFVATTGDRVRDALASLLPLLGARVPRFW